jgi:hypothetical protein
MNGIDSNGTEEKQAAGEAAWFKIYPVITTEKRKKSEPPASSAWAGHHRPKTRVLR